MSLLRHMDKSFRNIMATWGGLQRSQAALICSAGKTSPLCPSPAPLPPWTARVPGCHRGPTQRTRTGHENDNKECFFKKLSPCSWLILDIRAAGMGCSGTSVIQLPLDREHCPRLPAQGLPEVWIAFPALAAVRDMSDKTK